MTPKEVIEHQFGLLYQKDGDSQDFPLTEIERALACFARRPEFEGLQPAIVHLDPAHAGQVETDVIAALGLELEFDARVPRHHLWLRGRLKNGNGPAERAQSGGPDRDRGSREASR